MPVLSGLPALCGQSCPPALCFHPCQLRTSCPELLSGFSLCLWNLQASLLYVEVLTHFYWCWRGFSVPPGFENLCLSQIREVFCYNFSNIPSATPSFLFFWDPNYSNIVLLYGITYLLNSPLVIQSFLSLFSQLLYSPSFCLHITTCPFCLIYPSSYSLQFLKF